METSASSLAVNEIIQAFMTLDFDQECSRIDRGHISDLYDAYGILSVYNRWHICH